MQIDLEDSIKECLPKVGDTISWSFDHDSCLDECFRGNTFEAIVQSINYEEQYIDVYAEYGQDKIPFKDATLIKKEK